MSLRRLLWLPIIVCVSLTLEPSIAVALVCGQSESLPRFTATLDPSTAPAPPAEPASISSLEIYRAKLEIYRQNDVEGYNRKLIAYGDILKRLDQKFRKALSNGVCTPVEYDTLKEQLDQELTKIGSEYIDLYHRGLTPYTEYMKWCKIEIARKRLAG